MAAQRLVSSMQPRGHADRSQGCLHQETVTVVLGLCSNPYRTTTPPRIPVLLSVAALLLIVALCLGNGQFDRVGVFLAALGVGVSAFVALRREGVAPPASTSSTPTR